MQEKYYVKNSSIYETDFNIKCTCESCGYKFSQTKENAIKEEISSRWNDSKYISYKFNIKCPCCGKNKVKDDRYISAQKRKNSRDLTQRINDAAVACIKRTFTNIHVGAKEISSGLGLGERADAILFSLDASFLIETKISRADFIKDKEKDFRKKPERGMGDYRYFACPSGLIKPEELPDKWGLIYVDEKLRGEIIVGYNGSRDSSLDYSDKRQPIRLFNFEANLFAEKDLLISLCKRYKTRTGVYNLI